MDRFAFVTDTHLAEDFPKQQGVDTQKNWETLLADISRRGIRHIVFGGDIGEPSAHSAFFASLAKFDFQVMLGNHDDFTHVSQHFHPEPSRKELYYSVSYGENTFLFLDSSSDAVSAEQLKWLEAELAEPSHPLVFVHHPVLPVNTSVDALYPLQNRNELREVLEACGKKVTLFCGHYHTNDEQQVGNIRQIVTQAAAFQIVKGTEDVQLDTTTFGYRIVQFTDRQIITDRVTFQT